jgi:hypothetical protein
MPGDCGLIGHIAGTIVQDGWNKWVGYASEAIDDTQESLDALNLVDLSAIPLEIDYEIPTSLSVPFQKPASPDSPDLEYVEPQAPADPNLDPIGTPVLDALNLTDPDEPALSLPPAPNYLAKQAPSDAPALTEVTLPDAPAVTLPDEPVMRNIILPQAPVIQLPTFDKEAPAANIAEPQNTFSFVEELYQSNLLDKVTAKISEWLDGGTGLPDAIWQNIWEKNTEREDENGKKAVREATEEWAARGFTLPPGALTARVDDVRQQVLEAKNTASREVAIQAATMEVENLRFAVGQALALEDNLQSAHLQVQARALQAAQTTVEMSIAIFNAKVQLFNANIQAFSAEAEVYRTRLEAAIKELEVYRLTLEGKRIEGELNRQEVEIYTSRLQALNVQVDLYRTQIQAAQTTVDVDKAKIDVFKTRVEAYGEEVRAKTSEFQAYGEQIQGELAKVQIYEANVKAYAARIDAWKSKTDGTIAQTKLLYDGEDLKLRKYAAQLESYRAKIAAEVGRIEASSSIFDGESKMYVAELSAESARVESEDKQFALAMNSAQIEANIELKKAETNIAQLQRIAELQMEQLKTMATVQSSLAAGAMSAVNLSAGVTEGVTNSTGCTTNYSYSY